MRQFLRCQLTNLDQIKNYHNESLKTILADSNRIESILNIANSKFMANFSLFSLKHNLISPNQVIKNFELGFTFQFLTATCFVSRFHWMIWLKYPTARSRQSMFTCTTIRGNVIAKWP